MSDRIIELNDALFMSDRPAERQGRIWPTGKGKRTRPQFTMVAPTDPEVLRGLAFWMEEGEPDMAEIEKRWPKEEGEG